MTHEDFLDRIENDFHPKPVPDAAAVRPALRCSVTVYDRKSIPGTVFFRSCRGKVVWDVVVKGDYLFGVCQRHERRMSRAFPGWSKRERN